MTKDEWLTSHDPRRMLGWLVGDDGETIMSVNRVRQATDRKLFLFVAAVEEAWWGGYASAQDLASVRLMEAFADNPDKGRRGGIRNFHRIHFSYTITGDAVMTALRCVETHNSRASMSHRRQGDYHQWADILRDMVNPFRPAAVTQIVTAAADMSAAALDSGASQEVVRPSWLYCNDGAVGRAAKMIYKERSFHQQLPLLADMLEDAGCTDVELLSHCRSGDRHYKGCWLIDLLAEKE